MLNKNGLKILEVDKSHVEFTSWLCYRMEILKVDMDGVKLNAPRYPTVFTNQIPTSTFIECNYTRAKQFHYRYPLLLHTTRSYALLR